VLVLCTGNRWRSPLLAHCFRKLRPEWDVRSAGTHCSRPNAEVPRKWRAAVSGWTDPHRSAKVTDDDVLWADVVVCVQKSHVSAATAARADVRTVLHRLPDPAFRPVDEWPTLADTVVAAADAIVAEIDGVATV
jgi:protein-tyrosine-phosphatase